MRASKQEQTGSAGVSRVMADFADLNWGPVENTRHDLGVDIFLQVRDERRFDRLAFVMAQVKSGASYFADEVKGEGGEINGWWYAEGDAAHFEDWVQHGLPHLLVLHHPTTRTSYWVQVTKEAVSRTGNGMKILVPATNRVDSASRDALLDVAASAKTFPALQGTSFTASAKAVAPGRVLRHALLTPRLIAPHPNTGHRRTLEPEEAIALVTQGRLWDLQGFVRDGRNPKLESASARSRDWRWRFFAAYRSLVQEGDLGPLIQLAVTTSQTKSKRPGYEIAASAVTAAVALVDVERWDEAHVRLQAAGEDLAPVDHAWLLVHRAVLLAEGGDLEKARTLAATAQRILSLDADDVTAGAIGAASANLIFQTAGWGSGEFGAALTASDTAASWWRSQTVSWALGDHDGAAFNAWARCDDADRQYSTAAQNRLLGAWLSASLAGARGAAAAAIATRAHHELGHHEVAWRAAVASDLDAPADRVAAPAAGAPAATRRTRDATQVAAAQEAAKGLEEALDDLRRHGHHGDLDMAARRLWAAGPAAPLRTCLQRSLAARGTHTNAQARLAILERAGDLLDATSADEAAEHCLKIVQEPLPFVEQVRPNFSVDHYVHRALIGVLIAASDAAHAKVVDHVLQRVTASDNLGVQHDVLQLIPHLRAATVNTQGAAVHAIAVKHPDARLSAALFGALLAAGDRLAEQELMRRADAGDRDAVRELGAATLLSPVAAAALVERDAEGCRVLVADARNGSHGFGGWDSARALTVANFTFPALANWERVLEVVLDPLVAQHNKIDAVRSSALVLMSFLKK